MGSNNAKVINKTAENVIILVFSNSNLVQWHYRNLQIVPPGGKVQVSGFAGGGAIKIGVVYNTYADKYIFDLFRVPDCGTLRVQEINSSRARCTSTYGGSVEIIKKGQTISMNADAKEGTKFWLKVTIGSVVALVIARLALARRQTVQRFWYIGLGSTIKTGCNTAYVETPVMEIQETS